MVYFKDLPNDGNLYLCVVDTPTGRASTARHKFPIRRSMLRPDFPLDHIGMTKRFKGQRTTRIATENNEEDVYVLKSLLKEEGSIDKEFPMLGRRIIDNKAKWGSIQLKLSGEFSYIELYWEWTEEVISRCASELDNSGILGAVHASLHTYDRDNNILRAFCESWCSKTNTLHTQAGEWSISLWDLYRIGGLPVAGHIYDEAVPSYSVMEACGPDGKRLISRACQYLFGAYCHIADKPDFKNGVRATQWIHFWCKREVCYQEPRSKRARKSETRPKHTYNPSGDIPDIPSSWTPEEIETFSLLGIVDEGERKTTYLAAFISCWLCVFVLPDHEERLIRPGTFEVATQIASGARFSLAAPVLANIYHGLNIKVNALKPALSNPFFPAHYLYGWLAHYFGTHFKAVDPPAGPLMVSYGGHNCARNYSNASIARKLIHEGSSFRALSLRFSPNQRELILDNGQLDIDRLSYIISLRTTFLSLRHNGSFVLEPYSPTRFSRQFGYCQTVRGVLHLDAKCAVPRYSVVTYYLRMLLFEDSHSETVVPGYLSSWEDLTTDEFRTWWHKVDVSDLRRGVELLISSAENRKKDQDILQEGGIDNLRGGDTGGNPPLPATHAQEACAAPASRRTASEFSSNDDSEANFKHSRGGKKRKVREPPATWTALVFVSFIYFIDSHVYG